MRDKCKYNQNHDPGALLLFGRICLSSMRNISAHEQPGPSVPTTPACTWWNRPEKDHSSGKLMSTHPSRTSVKSYVTDRIDKRNIMLKALAGSSWGQNKETLLLTYHALGKSIASYDVPTQVARSLRRHRQRRIGL